MRSAATQGCRNRGTIIPSDFGRSVKPILIRGADYAHKITTHPLVFSDLPTALQLKLAFHLKVFSISPWLIYYIAELVEIYLCCKLGGTYYVDYLLDDIGADVHNY